MTRKTSPRCQSGLPAGQNVGRPVLQDPLQDRAEPPTVLPPGKALAVRTAPRRKLRLVRAKALPRNPRRRNPAAREERLRKNPPRKLRAARKRSANSPVYPLALFRKEGPEYSGLPLFRYPTATDGTV